MNYKFLRNGVVLGLLAVGVGLWGGNAESLRATGVNTSSGSTSGNISGEFETTGFDNPTVIHSVNLVNGLGYAFTPLDTETLTFDVLDLDGLSGLEVEVRLFHDTDHSSNTQNDEYSDNVNIISYTEYEGNATLDAAYENHDETNNDGDAFVLREKSNPASNDYFEVVYTTGVTSADVSWVLSTNGYSDSIDGYERSFSIDFTISKVAKYAENGEWTVGIRVLDSSDSSIVTEYFLTSTDMLWYGEIVIPETTAYFNGENGTVTVGSEYGSNTVTIEDVKFISNGSYEQLIGTDDSWSSNKATGQGSNYVGWVADSDTDLSMAQYFHMVVSDTSVGSGFTSLPTVDNMGFASTIVETHNGTLETGTLLNYYLYIKTSENFQNAVYTGTIYLGIQNPNFY